MTATMQNTKGVIDSLVTLSIMLPLHLAHFLLWLIWRGCKALWGCKGCIALCSALIASWGVCIVCPQLVVGLLIVAAIGYATQPKAKE